MPLPQMATMSEQQWAGMVSLSFDIFRRIWSELKLDGRAKAIETVIAVAIASPSRGAAPRFLCEEFDLR